MVSGIGDSMSANRSSTAEVRRLLPDYCGRTRIRQLGRVETVLKAEKPEAPTGVADCGSAKGIEVEVKVWDAQTGHEVLTVEALASRHGKNAASAPARHRGRFR